MKLIREITEAKDITYFVEDTTNSIGEKIKSYRFKGPFAIADVKNKNERIYPKVVLENAMNVYKNEYVDKKRALGTLEHGNVPQIDMAEVCHIVENLEMKDNIIFGEAKVLIDLPKGRILKTLMDNGVMVGISSRAVGNIKDGGVVDNDLVLCSFDCVLSPSGPNCFLENIIESREYIIQGNQIVEVAVNNLQKKVDKKYDVNVLVEYINEFYNEIKSGKRLIKE